MIAIPGNVRVWLATGHTDMRRGFPSLARLVQESLKRDPHAGDLYVFRGRRGDLIKIIWHDGQGACLFTKRLERGRFLWPSLTDGVVTISVAQLSYLLRHFRQISLDGLRMKANPLSGRTIRGRTLPGAATAAMDDLVKTPHLVVDLHL
jgi:transposase